ncbi:hypothetical protein DVA67_011810 [Solirubrobacter sp. CPCC 204708]|nr:hypothetical protein [Solirubrobacter deserti]
MAEAALDELLADARAAVPVQPAPRTPPAAHRRARARYTRAEAESSDRRALARELANAEADRPIGNEPLHTVGEDRLPA